MTTAVRVVSVIGSPRRQSFQQPPQDLGIDCHFLDAAMDVIDGVRVDEMLCYKHCGRLLVKGEIGNFCSHLLAWKELLADEQLTQMVVLEDDVLADWLAIKKIASVDWSQHGITYMKLYWKYPAKFNVKYWSYPIVDRHIVQFTTLALGANAYLITRQAAKSFVDAMGVISRPVDVEMDRPWSTGVPVFGILPVCAMELALPSTIKNREVVQHNTIPRWRYLRGRAIEHAWANSYKLTSLSPASSVKRLVDRSIAIFTNRTTPPGGP